MPPSNREHASVRLLKPKNPLRITFQLSCAHRYTHTVPNTQPLLVILDVVGKLMDRDQRMGVPMRNGTTAQRFVTYSRRCCGAWNEHPGTFASSNQNGCLSMFRSVRMNKEAAWRIPLEPEDSSDDMIPTRCQRTSIETNQHLNKEKREMH